MKLTINWEVEDGYAGRSRPQTTKINTDDWIDAGEYEKLKDDEKNAIIYEAVDDDFNQKISYSITSIEEE